MIKNMHRACRLALFLGCTPLTSLAQSQQAAQSTDSAIVRPLMRYEEALNTSNVDAVMKCYTDDAVVLAPNQPTAVGADKLRAIYSSVFDKIKLNVKFKIDEVVPMSEDWAFVRTQSTGTVTVLKDGKQLPEANQELFILHRQTGNEWRVARYSFSPTLQAPATGTSSPKP